MNLVIYQQLQYKKKDKIMAYVNNDFVKWLHKNNLDDGVVIQDNGSLIAVGDSILWDDLKVNPSSGTVIGVLSPNYTIVSNDGSESSGTGFTYDTNTSNGVVDYYSDMNSNNLTISMWIKPSNAKDRELIDRNGNNGFEFYIDNKRLGFAIDGANSVRTDRNTIIKDITQFVTVTVEDIGTRSTIRLYINGVKEIDTNKNAHLQSSSLGYILGQWHHGGYQFVGIQDDIEIYNKVLTDAQILEMYNGGQGLTGLPTGIVESTDLIARFQDSFINQATLGSGFDITPTNITLSEGLVGILSGSLGVMGLEFEPNETESIFSSVQLNHTYEEGTELIPHIHWNKPGNETPGDVVWGLEYMWVNIGEQGGSTTVIKKTIVTGAQGFHNMTDLPTIDGTGKRISSVLQLRFFRDGSNPLDTYTGNVIVSEFDFHYRINTAGSRQITIK